MYGPRARVRVQLFLVASSLLFVGALALPFLVEEDVVRLRFAGDGLRTQGGGDELVPKVNVQTDLRPPRALVTTPDTSGSAHFTVRWDGDGPDPATQYAFHLQYGIVDASAEDEIAWHDWFTLRRSDVAREAVFTGAPAEHYAFRARTCDLLAQCGAWSSPETTQVVEGAAAPDVRLFLEPGEPAADQVVNGRVAIAWEYEHDGPGDVIVSVTVRPVDEQEGTPIYSGAARSTVWDTRAHPDGTYVVTIGLRDGIHHVGHDIPVRVAHTPPDQVEMTAPEQAAEEEGDPRAATEESLALSPLVPVVASLAWAAHRRMR